MVKALFLGRKAKLEIVASMKPIPGEEFPSETIQPDEVPTETAPVDEPAEETVPSGADQLPETPPGGVEFSVPSLVPDAAPVVEEIESPPTYTFRRR